ncbi:rCG24742 [Rattus norvegicus]|uniref:RCG24742 n=1 Tax=Rattus norvegicus TaxID=10116 RepID=A6JC32_RAT|nr:rCG24742 [Rattus norvegicus]
MSLWLKEVCSGRANTSRNYQTRPRIPQRNFSRNKDIGSSVGRGTGCLSSGSGGLLCTCRPSFILQAPPF